MPHGAAVDPLDRIPPSRIFAEGTRLARQGDPIRAEQYLAAALDRGYPAEKVMPVLLRVCIGASRYRPALAYAEPYLARHPQISSLRLLVASLYLGLGNVDRAEEEIRRAANEAPETAEPNYVLAVLLRDERGNLEESRHRFARYLELAPQGAHAAEARAALMLASPSDGPPPDDATARGTTP